MDQLFQVFETLGDRALHNAPMAKTQNLPPVADYLPTTRAEMDSRGWDQADIIFVSGDAYLDHPSFAAALLGRVLESQGFRVAILSQPEWKNVDAWRELGAPKLFYAVSAGNMDSMINHYTANKKRRNTDAYSPGGQIERRPDRATNVYAQRCREAFKGVPVLIGGVEASLRRIAHYDYWSDTVRPSVLVSSKAEMLGFGMGEEVIVQIAQGLQAGKTIKQMRHLRGTAYLLGKREELPSSEHETRELPSFEQVKEDGRSFAIMTRDLHYETSPFNGRRLIQAHGDRTLVINPPQLPLEEEALDAVYDLPYTRLAHPSYQEPIPAHEMIKDSITIMRG
ncbi:MAG: putative radical SAM protein YgiQ, partial [Candidatus Paceibacteria bacterium]